MNVKVCCRQTKGWTFFIATLTSCWAYHLRSERFCLRRMKPGERTRLAIAELQNALHTGIVTFKTS